MRLLTLHALVASGLGLAQMPQPVVINAQVHEVSALAGLDVTIRKTVSGQNGPLWVGYAVPTLPGDRQNGCWSSDGRVRSVAPVRLEGATHVGVLQRYENGVAGKVRVISLECSVDGGGLPFYWITGTTAEESVAMLSARPEPPIHAIAMHAGDEAFRALEKFASPGNWKEQVRKEALFWLANSRARRGFEIVARVAREDASDKVREHAVFALTQTTERDAIPLMISMARADRNSHVRGQALFWLAQKASREAAQAITESIENDPDTEVRKRAVFALSQLPKEEGVPRLIQLAQSNANPVVRKQAMFWLGQSKDARALDFFERILLK